jgi:hypothetical protein
MFRPGTKVVSNPFQDTWCGLNDADVNEYLYAVTTGFIASVQNFGQEGIFGMKKVSRKKNRIIERYRESHVIAVDGKGFRMLHQKRGSCAHILPPIIQQFTEIAAYIVSSSQRRTASAS